PGGVVSTWSAPRAVGTDGGGGASVVDGATCCARVVDGAGVGLASVTCWRLRSSTTIATPLSTKNTSAAPITISAVDMPGPVFRGGGGGTGVGAVSSGACGAGAGIGGGGGAGLAGALAAGAGAAAGEAGGVPRAVGIEVRTVASDTGALIVIGDGGDGLG